MPAQTKAREKTKEKTMTLKLTVREVTDLVHAARSQSHGLIPQYESNLDETLKGIEEDLAKAEDA